MSAKTHAILAEDEVELITDRPLEPNQTATVVPVRTPFNFERAHAYYKIFQNEWKTDVCKVLSHLRTIMNSITKNMLVNMQFAWGNKPSKCLVVGFNCCLCFVNHNTMHAMFKWDEIQLYVREVVGKWGFCVKFENWAYKRFTVGPYVYHHIPNSGLLAGRCAVVLNKPSRDYLVNLVVSEDLVMRAVVKFDNSSKEPPIIRFQQLR